MILFSIAVSSFSWCEFVLQGHRAHGWGGWTRFIFTGLASGIDSPSTVSLVICHVMWSSSVFVTMLVADAFLPSAVLAVVLRVHLLPSFVQAASPNPPRE